MKVLAVELFMLESAKRGKKKEGMDKTGHLGRMGQAWFQTPGFFPRRGLRHGKTAQEHVGALQ